MVSTNKFSTHERRHLLCCFPFCRLLRFQHHLLAQGFPGRSWKFTNTSDCARKLLVSFANTSGFLNLVTLIAEASDSCKSPQYAIIKSPDQPLPARGAQPKNMPFSAFCPNWCIIDLSFAVVGIYSTSVPKGTDGPSNFLPYLFANAVFPSAILSCTLRKWSEAFHRTVPPFLLAVHFCTSSDCWSFFHSADGPFCHTFRWWAMRSACVVISL